MTASTLLVMSVIVLLVADRNVFPSELANPSTCLILFRTATDRLKTTAVPLADAVPPPVSVTLTFESAFEPEEAPIKVTEVEVNESALTASEHTMLRGPLFMSS